MDSDRDAVEFTVTGLWAGYFRGVPIVNGVDVHCSSGEIVAAIGPNGSGKSTMLRGMVGLTTWRRGAIRLGDCDLSNAKTAAAIAAGIAYVPQGHQVFGAMSVRENLLAGRFGASGTRTSPQEVLATVLDQLPMLAPLLDRKAKHLSGGQQQMVSLGRALASRPHFLLVDEPTAGLSPLFAELVFDTLAALKATGVGIVLVEQNARRALAAADRALVLDLGHVVQTDTAARIRDDDAVERLYLGRTAANPGRGAAGSQR